MPRVEWYVWSSGLEEWEPIEWDPDPEYSLLCSHTKTVGGLRLQVFIDPTGRYVGALWREAE